MYYFYKREISRSVQAYNVAAQETMNENRIGKVREFTLGVVRLATCASEPARQPAQSEFRHVAPLITTVPYQGHVGPRERRLLNP